jgi:D-xylose transport system permease protein
VSTNQEPKSAIDDVNMRSIATDYIAKVKSGDIGALPAILGLIALGLIFKFSSGFFLTDRNLANLITQSAPVMVIAMGLIFVLLLGEIDLAAGFTSGVCGASMVLLINNHKYPWYAAFLVSLVVGLVLGFAMGILRARLGIPSFVVTLSAFLAFQGVLLLMAGNGGTIPLQDRFIIAVENSNLTPTQSWLFFIVAMGGYLSYGLRRILNGRKTGVKVELFKVWLLRNLILTVLAGIATYMLNGQRGNPPRSSIKGMPIVVLLLLFLLFAGTFTLQKTKFGRYLYAVGGNAEAARRAGINVAFIRTMAFVICSGFAAIAGMLFASRSNSISPTTGGGTTLLYAVGAAVIGGTSLFGGRGKMRDAVLGGLVVATIDNGMGLLGFSSGTQYLVTGGVLLISASVDAISRKGAAV